MRVNLPRLCPFCRKELSKDDFEVEKLPFKFYTATRTYTHLHLLFNCKYCKSTIKSVTICPKCKTIITPTTVHVC